MHHFGITFATLVPDVGIQTDMTKRLLIVEDNEDMLEVLTLSLEAEGFFIDTARSGVEAVRKARYQRPDAILLDLMLPEMDGFGVCETLRRHPATKAAPILFLSGDTGERTRAATMQSGGTDFIAKPANPKELAIRIRAALGQPSQATP